MHFLTDQNDPAETFPGIQTYKSLKKNQKILLAKNLWCRSVLSTSFLIILVTSFTLSGFCPWAARSILQSMLWN